MVELVELFSYNEWLPCCSSMKKCVEDVKQLRRKLSCPEGKEEGKKKAERGR